MEVLTKIDKKVIAAKPIFGDFRQNRYF